MTAARSLSIVAAVLLAAALAAMVLIYMRGPSGLLRLPRAWQPQTAHEAYADGLRSSGLAETALGRDWIAAATRALADPVPMPAPFREDAWFPADEARAVAYRLTLRRGQRLVMELVLEGATDTHVFLDLFTATDPPAPVSSAAPGTITLATEVDRDGDYLLRIQPELLRAVRVRVNGGVSASLRFPVAGVDARALQSVFGAERDAGRRQHEGVDIFAARGTPVLAAADGIVGSVTTNALGGNVVWLWDTGRGLTHYYAHLTQQDVSAGQRVAAGDRLGTVGNTGNARTTPPHLHFGLYERGRGAIDPAYFVASPPPVRPLPTGSPVPGAIARVVVPGTNLRAGPRSTDGSLVLDRHTIVAIVGRTHGAVRARLPDGREGYVVASAVAAATTPVVRERTRVATPLLHAPMAGAPTVATLGAGSSYVVLGRFRGFAFGESAGGVRGWVAQAATVPDERGGARRRPGPTK